MNCGVARHFRLAPDRRVVDRDREGIWLSRLSLAVLSLPAFRAAGPAVLGACNSWKVAVSKCVHSTGLRPFIASFVHVQKFL